MSAYQAPGRLAELNPALLNAWNTVLKGQFAEGVKAAKSEAPTGVTRPWFYDGVSDTGTPSSEPAVTWTAFPRRVTQLGGTLGAQRQVADSDRARQDEYCEWSVIRNDQNKVVRVVLTTETPDYYRFLATSDPQLLLDLYRRFVSPDVELSDLIVGGQYDKDNRWNFPAQPANDGFIMHMREGANNLFAAVLLAAQASWPRRQSGGQLITAEQPLIACGSYGVGSRHSDPHIGAQINALVRAGNRVTIADPAGLYIDNVDLSDWERPDGGDPEGLKLVERGEPGFAMRMAFEAPAGANFVLGDVMIGGEPLRFGGQIAELMKIRLQTATRARPGAPAIPCAGGGGGLALAAAKPAEGAMVSRSGNTLE